VLENESGINAFAAGVEPKDTIVGVTQGALEHLDRSQLQGVLAHEFSHIVNQDVRINVQTLGALQGIEAIASAAKYLLRMGVSSGLHGSMLAIAFECVLWPVGQIGILFGSIAKMSLNRQREFLADAAAVQFTRYPEGLSSALKLIAEHARQGQMESGAAQTASHLFFAEGTSPLGSLLRSHPSLEMRIRRLDPGWDGVIPITLPDCAAELLGQKGDRVDNDVDVVESLTGAARSTKQQPLRQQPPPRVQHPSDDTSKAAVIGSAIDGGISEANKQAFLETLASVSASHSPRKYNPDVSHLPTLLAAAAAVIGASAVFADEG